MDTPALDHILAITDTWQQNPDGSRNGCSDCPFAANPRDVNLSDPDEGYYDCELLNEASIWGEDPKCTGVDWKIRARHELAKIRTEPTTTLPTDNTEGVEGLEDSIPY